MQVICVYTHTHIYSFKCKAETGSCEHLCLSVCVYILMGRERDLRSAAGEIEYSLSRGGVYGFHYCSDPTVRHLPPSSFRSILLLSSVFFDQ